MAVFGRHTHIRPSAEGSCSSARRDASPPFVWSPGTTASPGTETPASSILSKRVSLRLAELFDTDAKTMERSPQASFDFTRLQNTPAPSKQQQLDCRRDNQSNNRLKATEASARLCSSTLFTSITLRRFITSTKHDGSSSTSTHNTNKRSDNVTEHVRNIKINVPLFFI